VSEIETLASPQRVLFLTCEGTEGALRLHGALIAKLWGAHLHVWSSRARDPKQESALEEAHWNCAGWEAGSLAGQPRLVETLREFFQHVGPDWLVLECANTLTGRDAIDDRNALCWAALSAASLAPDCQVVLLDPPAERDLPAPLVLPSKRALPKLRRRLRPEGDRPTATAVVSTWNKADDVCANLEALRAQVEAFDEIVLVDNASSDDTVARVRRDFPNVRVVTMPNDRYGACETFNIGFACANTDLTAILDDDVVLPAAWLALTKSRMLEEPASTAVVSTKIVEPGMPESYVTSPAINSERYMSTFRGCASLARTAALKAAGGYDERLFIYGNERDLTCRLMNLGFRVLQYPEAVAYHKTPFGIKMGKRSLFYHARNAWLSMLKYAPWGDLARMPVQVFRKVLLRSSETEAKGEVTDATGTIGIGRSLRETKGAWWVLIKAAASVLYNVPYCLKRRQAVRHQDFELPLD